MGSFLLVLSTASAQTVTTGVADAGVPGDVGQYSSQAMVAGNPAIAYFSAETGSLKFARNSAADGSGTWTIREVSSYPSEGGTYCSLAVVNGNPAIGYRNNVGTGVKFVRALDATGDSWGGSSTLYIDPNGKASLTDCALVVVNGLPRVFFNTTASYLQEGLYYVGAYNASGSTWGSYQWVASGSFAGISVVASGSGAFLATSSGGLKVFRDPVGSGFEPSPVTVTSGSATGISLQMVNGLPAIGFKNWAAGQIQFVRATAANGTAWGEPVNVGLNGYSCSLAVVNGNPAMACWDSTNEDLYYVRATDANGSAWGQQLLLDADGRVGQYSSLIAGSAGPTVSYYDATNQDLKFARGTDASGATWAAPLAVDGSSGLLTDVGKVSASCSINGGIVAVCYLDATTNRMKFTRTTSTAGQTWELPVVIDIPSSPVTLCSISVVGGFPAVAYANGMSVHYARALDSVGSRWDTSRTIDTLSSPCTGVSVTDGNGQPSIAYSNGTSLSFAHYDSYYGWQKTTVVSGGGSYCQVSGAAGVAVMVYYHDTNHTLNLITSKDNAGTLWNSPRVIESSATICQQPSFMGISNFGFSFWLSYYDVTNGNLKFTSGSVSSSVYIATPVVVDSTGDVGAASSVAFVAGKPVISYYDVTNTKLKFARATDSGGTSWMAPVTVDAVPTRGIVSSVVESYSTALITYYDPPNGDLRWATVETPSEIAISGNGNVINSGDTSPSTTDFTDFGSLSVANGMVTKTFTIANSGDGPLNLTGSPAVMISGPQAQDFIVSVVPTTPVAKQTSTTFQIQFDPSAPGLRSATVTVLNNDIDEGTYTFAIQGTGTGGAAPEIVVSGNGNVIVSGGSTTSTTDGTDFGSVDVNTGAVVTHTFTIGNIGGLPLTLSGTPRVTLSGNYPTDFAISTMPVQTVPSSSATTFAVSFDPGGIGTRTAIVTISNNDGDEGSFSFTVGGTATGSGPMPEIAVTGNGNDIFSGDSTPDTADFTDFGGAEVFAGTVVHTFSVLNLGNDPLSLNGMPRVAVTGAHASDFTVTALPASSVASRGSTTFQITFDPSAAGVRTATISIASNDGNESSFTFNVQGAGDVPTAGARDLLFGTLGVSTFTDSSYSLRAQDLAIASDGSIYMVGTAQSSGSPAFSALVVKFTSSGVLDPSFGTGGSKLITLASDFHGRAIGIAADGSLRIGGHSGSAFVVVGLSSTGASLAGFGTSGTATVTLPGTKAVVRGMALQSDGKILVTGSSSQVNASGSLTGYTNLRLLRLTSSGVADSTFGTAGLVTVSAPNDSRAGNCLAIESGGSILVAGTYGTVEQTRCQLLRFSAVNGALDSTLDGDGSAPFPSLGSPLSMATQANGKITLLCSRVNAPGITVARVSAAGALDTTMNNGDGTATLNVGTTDDAPAGLAVRAADGRMFVGDTSMNGTALAFTLLRLNSDGTADSLFDGDGVVSSNLGVGFNSVSGLKLQSNGKILLFGSAQMAASPAVTGLVLMRYHPGDPTTDSLPSIGTHPANQTVALSSSVTFTVVSTSALAQQYVWRKNGTVISGQNAATLSIASAQVSDEGSYTVQVSNAVGTVASNPATLTVTAPPVVQSSPVNFSALGGTNGSFSVTVTGRTPLTYQWQKNGSDFGSPVVSSSFTNSLAVTAEEANEGAYRCVITNSEGTATSGAAMLDSTPNLPVIMTEPSGISAPGGTNGSFTVAVTGRAPFTYQWQKDGVNYGSPVNSSSGTSTLSVLVDDANEGSYRVIISNVDGSTNSNAVPLVSTANPPVITAQPLSQGSMVGTAVNLSVTVTGRPPFTFQWQRGTSNQGSAVVQASGTHTLTIPGQATNADVYRCVIANADGSATSEYATIGIWPQGTVKMTPGDVLLSDGAPLSLRVSLYSGFATLGYQWQRDGKNIADTTATLQRSVGGFADAGTYRCLIATTGGQMTSGDLHVAVVESGARQVVGAAGKSVTLTAKTSGTGLTYAWSKAGGPLSNGGRISGADKASLVITNVSAATDLGVYRCDVTGYGQTQTTGDITLIVESEKPVLSAVTLGTTTVGLPFEAQLSATHSPSKFTATGLPAGLACDPDTGLISGAATVAGTFQVKLTAANPVGSSATLTSSLQVLPLPGGIAGTYSGLVGFGGALTTTRTSAPIGTLTLTVAATGNYTGTLSAGAHDGVVTSQGFSGQLKDAASGLQHYDSTSTTMTLPVAFEGGGAFVLSLTWDPAQQTLIAMLSRSSPALAFGVKLIKNPWNAKTLPATKYAGPYTNSFDNNAADVGCKGDGYSSFTVATAGTFTLVGRLSDGTALSIASFIDANGETWVQRWLSGNKGSLSADFKLSGGSAPSYYDTNVGGTAIWTRPSGTTVLVAPFPNDYQNGISNRTMAVVGARYLPPNLGLTTGPLMFEARNELGNLEITFASGVQDYQYPEKSLTDQGSVSLISTLNTSHGVSLPTFSTGNDWKVTKITLNAATGSFTGTATRYYWDLAGTTATLTVPVAFQGVVVRTDASLLGSIGIGNFTNTMTVNVTDGSRVQAVPMLLSGGIQLTPTSTP